MFTAIIFDHFQKINPYLSFRIIDHYNRNVFSATISWSDFTKFRWNLLPFTGVIKIDTHDSIKSGNQYHQYSMFDWCKNCFAKTIFYSMWILYHRYTGNVLIFFFEKKISFSILQDNVRMAITLLIDYIQSLNFAINHWLFYICTIL